MLTISLFLVLLLLEPVVELARTLARLVGHASPMKNHVPINYGNRALKFLGLPDCHSRERGNPLTLATRMPEYAKDPWVPVFPGMTQRRQGVLAKMRLPCLLAPVQARNLLFGI